MTKIIQKFVSFAACLCIMSSVLPADAVSAADAEAMTLVNMEFDSVNTNAEPSGITVTNASAYVRMPDALVKNKTLEVKKSARPLTLDFSHQKAEGSIAFRFDIMLKDDMSPRTLSITDGSVTADLFTINADGTVVTADGRYAAKIETARWYTLSGVCRLGDKRFDIYADGKSIASQCLMSNAEKLSSVSALRFSQPGGGYGSVFYLDNVCVFRGDKILDAKSLRHEAFNSDTEEIAEERNVDDTESVYIFTNFNDDKTNSAPSGGNPNTKNDSNKISVADIPGAGNKSLMVSKGGDGDPYIDFAISGFAASAAVLEVSFCSVDTSSDKLITFRDSLAKFNEVMRLKNGGVLSAAGKNIGTYEAEKWYKLAFVMDYNNLVTDVYVDGEKVAEKLSFANIDSDVPSTLRIQYPGSSSAGTVYFDDLKFYAGNKFRDDEELLKARESSGEASRRSLTASEDDVKAELNNTVAMQMYGNAAFANGKKTLLSKAAEIKDGVAYVPLRYTAESLGGNVSWDSAARGVSVKIGDISALYTVDSDTVKCNGQTESMENAVYMSENTMMLPASEFSLRLADAQINFDDKYGIIVIDRDKKNLSSVQLKDIYDYITYARPKAKQILGDFESMKNVHPRIMTTEKRFDEISEEIKSDANMSKWYKKLIADSEAVLKQNHTYYYIPDGLRLLEMSRQLLRRSYTLSMAYRLTADERYLDYLWGEIDAVCNFNDWNSSRHFLDTAEMMTGVSIAYDWCYDFWSDGQRQLMEDAVLNMGLKEGEKFYNFNGSGTQWQTINNNWSMVCNGGMSVAALALMDKYPEYCSGIIETAFLSLENALGEFSPDGAWVEGPAYWSYAIQYLGYHMSALESALGTDYGYLKTNNLKSTGYYMTCTQSAQGSFNVGDGESTPTGNAAVLYVSRYFNDPAITQLRLRDIEDYGLNTTAIDMLYYDPEMASGTVDLPLDYKFRDVEMATFRSAWSAKTALFAGIKGGYNDSVHGNLDSGTFVIDALGERWAAELGADNYNQSNYFVTANALRYYLYYCSTQGQNVLALNPVSELGQEQFGFTKITDFVSKPKGGYAIIDMSSAYGRKTESAKRGLKVDNNRTQVVVQDELKLKNKTDVWWFMHTKAKTEVSQNGKYVILTQNGKKMYVGLESSVTGAKFSVAAAQPLEGSSVKAGVNSTEAYSRLQVHLPDAKGEVKLSVRFVPIVNDFQLTELLDNGTEKMIAMNRWNIPDGEVSLPALKSLSVNGAALDNFNPYVNIYNVDVDFGTDKAPLTEAAAEDGCSVEIIQAKDPGGTAKIRITDKQGAENYYSVCFKVQPYIGQPEGYQKYDIKNVTVSAEPQKENPKENAADGFLDTRWSSDGDNEWIQADLGSVKDISVVTLAFYSGKQRVTYFDILISEDGKKWSTVFSGESSGMTDGYESYFIGSKKARYVKINCFGNSLNKWNSLSEIEIYGKNEAR